MGILTLIDRRLLSSQSMGITEIKKFEATYWWVYIFERTLRGVQGGWITVTTTLGSARPLTFLTPLLDRERLPTLQDRCPTDA